MSVVSEEKQRSERSQIFHFNIGEVKCVVSIVRDFISVLRVKLHSESGQRFHLMVVKENSVVYVVS